MSFEHDCSSTSPLASGSDSAGAEQCSANSPLRPLEGGGENRLRKLMIERRPILDAISHLVLVLGVIIVAFPIYVAFVASTQTAEQAASASSSGTLRKNCRNRKVAVAEAMIGMIRPE